MNYLIRIYKDVSVSAMETFACCPLCNSELTHFDQVHISARKEDAEFTEIRVNAITADVEMNAGPGPGIDWGRRYRISLIGWCEYCGHEFAIVFRQVKGNTPVEIVNRGEIDVREKSVTGGP